METDRVAYFDLIGGMSGDMTLAALLDAGAPLAALEEALESLNLDGISVHLERVERSGIQANQLGFRMHGQDLDAQEHGHEHEHEHEHGHEHGHRAWVEIRNMIETSRLSEPVKQRSLRIFGRLAQAEAKVHGQHPDKVMFHEVGAVDSIADIVGVSALLDSLGIGAMHASIVTLGSGTVRCAHGILPLPAPATLSLLLGVPCRTSEEPGERVTPTGAAILAECAVSFGPMPTMCPSSIGYGAGRRTFKSGPNVLRVVIGNAMDRPEEAWVHLETNIDDLDPRVLGALWDPFFEAGAVDAWIVHALMKKGRPGWVLNLLCPLSAEDRLVRLLLRETSTLGVRRSCCQRRTAFRSTEKVNTPWGEVSVKIGCLSGRVLNVQPELEDCVRVAKASGIPLKRVLKAADAEARVFWDRPQASFR